MSSLPWLGEWATPDMIAGVLRPRFLNMVSVLRPAVLESLRDDVLPVYGRAGSVGCQTLTICESAENSGNTSASASRDLATGPAPTECHMVRFEHDYAGADRDLFTEEEASVLFDQGYELLGDVDATGPQRFYLWRPKEGRDPEEPVPERSCLDYDELEHYLAELQAALSTWARAFHLDKPWVLEVARRQLNAWHRHWYLAHPHVKWPRPERPAEQAETSWLARSRTELREASGLPIDRGMIGPDRLEWLLFPPVVWFLPTSEDDRRLVFEHVGWDPTAATRQDARARILVDFERFLDEYLDRMEEKLVATWERGRPSPHYHDLDRYLRWLVRYQCLDESFPDIDRAESGWPKSTGETVEKPVRDLAGLIDLKLRPGRIGRPPGAKNRSRKSPSRRSLLGK